MTNEITKNENVAVEVVNEKPAFDFVTAGEKVIRISIKCKIEKRLDNGKPFNSIKGLKHLTVIDEDGVDIGKHNRWLDLHFRQDAFKVDKQESRNFDDLMDLKTGFLYVIAKYIDSPKKYVIKEDEETGELKYPEIWIRGGIVGFEPLVAEQDEFDYVPEAKAQSIEAKTETIEMDTKAD